MILKRVSASSPWSNDIFKKNFTCSYILGFFAFVTILTAIPKLSFADGLTVQQGDAILKELKQINKRLESIEKLGIKVRRSGPSYPTRASVSTSGNPILGNSKAPLTLVEFTDYQCPFCKRFVKEALPQIKKKYIDTGKLRLVLRDLPLSFHKLAKPAAKATHCAGEQGKYWQMHDKLFEGEKLKNQNEIFILAKEVVKDPSLFKQCMESEKYNKEIEKDISDAGKAQISGTPGFVLGETTSDVVKGTLISGIKPFSFFDDEIKKLLKKTEGKAEKK